MADMTISQKYVFCLETILALREKITNKKAAASVDRAIALIRKWLNEKTDVSYELYDLLDNEENGFTVFQESETDERMKAVWNCIIDAAAYICREVYEGAGAVYFPEPIEAVDEDTYLRLTKSYHSLREQYAAES